MDQIAVKLYQIPILCGEMIGERKKEIKPKDVSKQDWRGIFQRQE